MGKRLVEMHHVMHKKLRKFFTKFSTYRNKLIKIFAYNTCKGTYKEEEEEEVQIGGTRTEREKEERKVAKTWPQLFSLPHLFQPLRPSESPSDWKRKKYCCEKNDRRLKRFISDKRSSVARFG